MTDQAALEPDRPGVVAWMADRRPDGLKRSFFAVPDNASRDRRPTDIIMLVFTAALFAVVAARATSEMSDLEASISDVVAKLPSFFDPLWRIAHDSLVVWSVIVVCVAFVRRRWSLLRDLTTAVLLVVLVSESIGRLVNGEWPHLADGIFHTHSLIDFPFVGLALWVALASVASSHLSRPYRYLSRWIVAVGSFAAFALGITTPSGSIGAVMLGLAVASVVHLVFGSPGGLPRAADIEEALLGLDVEAHVLDVARRNGVVRVRAIALDGGELDVKVYGRDAWDGQLLVSLWRFAWYRDGGPTLALTRLQQVEHEAFLTLLAERRGASVAPVVAAGTNSLGDALLVVRRIGTSLADVDRVRGPQLVGPIWACLASLHKTGIRHGSIDQDRVFVDGDKVAFADLATSAVEWPPNAILIDRAQLLVTTAMAFGLQQAIDGAVAAIGHDALADVSSYLQPAALSPRLNRELSARDEDVDDIRAAAVAAAGGEQRDLQRLRRLSVGRVLMVALLFVAVSTLISSLLDIGIDAMWDAIKQANFAVVALALGISMFSRPANAFALTGLAPTKVPFGRLTVLQFAMSFVNLAMPSTAGRIAVNVRFFQRSGVDPTTAIAIGAIDGFTGFLSQMLVGGTVLLFGLGTLNFSLDDTFSFDNVRSILILMGLAAVLVVVVVAVVPALRRRVIDAAKKVLQFIIPLLHAPRRLATTMCGNICAELISSMTLYTVLRAFDQRVNYADVILVGIAVSLFAGLMPVPGGIGVTEAALTVGFIAMGVPDDIALAAALTSRVVTYYAPPLYGWFAFRWLRRQRFL